MVLSTCSRWWGDYGAFDTDAARYELDDDAYQEFEKDSGIYALVATANEMQDRLNEPSEQRR